MVQKIQEKGVLMDYFINCETCAEADKLYKDLAKKHHPDKGGDTETMQQINADYQAVIERLSSIAIQKSDTVADAPAKKRKIKLTKQTEDGLKRHGSELLKNVFSAVFENLSSRYIERI